MIVKNRELLRNFKALKEKLLSGEVKEVIIPQGDKVQLKIVIEKSKTPFRELADIVKTNPVKLCRPKEDIFEL